MPPRPVDARQHKGAVASLIGPDPYTTLHVTLNLLAQNRFLTPKPRGSIYTTIMELAPKRPSPLWFWGPNSIIGVYMDPLGKNLKDKLHLTRSVALEGPLRDHVSVSMTGSSHGLVRRTRV